MRSVPPLIRIPRSAHRFMIVGTLNTLLDLSVFLLLRNLGLPIVIANLISTTAGMVLSYVGNRSFTFRSRQVRRVRVGKQALLFLAVTGFGQWVLQPMVILALTSALGTTGRPLGPLAAVIPKLGGISVGLIWNYTLYNRLVFRARH